MTSLLSCLLTSSKATSGSLITSMPQTISKNLETRSSIIHFLTQINLLALSNFQAGKENVDRFVEDSDFCEKQVMQNTAQRHFDLGHDSQKVVSYFSNLVERRQQQTREDCLKTWKVPDLPRSVPDRFERPQEALKRLLGVTVQRQLGIFS